MSKLLEKLKKEAEARKEISEKRGSGEFQKINWFVPSKGENMVRVLPHHKDPSEVFFKSVHLHYGVTINKTGGGTVKIPARCLRNFGKECPLCEKYEEMLSAGDKSGAGNYRPSERFLYNLVEYKSKKVWTWAAPVTVHDGFMGWVGELGEKFADLDNGRDWKVIKEVDPSKPPQFGTSYKVMPRLKESALPEKLKVLLADGITDLDTLYAEDHEDAMLAMTGGTKSAPVEKKSKTKEVEADAPEMEEDDDWGDAGSVDASAEMSSEDDELEKELRNLGV